MSGADEVSASIQNMVEATICTIIRLYTGLNGMADQADVTPSLKVQIKKLVLVTCYFLDA